MNTISQRYNEVRSRLRQWLLGTFIVSSTANVFTSGLNSIPQAVQITTATVADPGDNLTVSITIAGETVSVGTGVGLAVADIGALLAAAINANPITRGVCIATFAVTTLTLTGLYPNNDFLVTAGNSTSAVTNTQSAAAAASIPFARAVIQTGWNDSENEPLVALADVNRFTAQVVKISYGAYVASAKLRARVYEVRGSERELIADRTETSATDLATTLTALAAQLNAQLPANSVNVTVTDTNTTLSFTAERIGMEIDVEGGAGDEGASVPVPAVTYPTGPDSTTSLHRAWAGISMYSDSDEAPTVGADGEYGPNAGVKYAQIGPVAVASDESPSRGGAVFVELAAGANAGRFYVSGGATRVRLSRQHARWERDGLVAGDSMAALRLLTF